MLPFSERKTQQIAEAEYELWLHGLSWSTSNQGVHLLIYADGKHVAHYWPTTERFCLGKSLQNNRSYGLTLEHLLNRLTTLHHSSA